MDDTENPRGSTLAESIVASVAQWLGDKGSGIGTYPRIIADVERLLSEHRASIAGNGKVEHFAKLLRRKHAAVVVAAPGAPGGVLLERCPRHDGTCACSATADNALLDSIVAAHVAALELTQAMHEDHERGLGEIAALRRELADFMADVRSYRATLGAAELESLPSAIARVKGELAARTEERDAARKALWLTWLNGHDFNFNDRDKKMINAQLDLAAEASK